MIRLIRVIDSTEILLNANLVQDVKEIERGRTLITMKGGEEVIVKNTILDITQKIAAYRIGLAEGKKTDGKDKKKQGHEKKQGHDKKHRNGKKQGYEKKTGFEKKDS